MALSKQKASSATLLEFLAYAHGLGYHVGEHPQYGGVDDSVHRPESWHADGLAADINWRRSGSERDKLLELIPVAESFGLGLTFARDGTTGSAATHTSHLHVDVGSYSNYGSGAVPAKGPRPSQQPATGEDWNMHRIDLSRAHEKTVRDKHLDQLQGLLMAHGYGPSGLVGRSGRPDGVGGRATRAALGRFQVSTDSGTDGKPDYVAGPQTWAALMKG